MSRYSFTKDIESVIIPCPEAGFSLVFVGRLIYLSQYLFRFGWCLCLPDDAVWKFYTPEEVPKLDDFAMEYESVAVQFIGDTRHYTHSFFQVSDSTTLASFLLTPYRVPWNKPTQPMLYEVAVQNVTRIATSGMTTDLFMDTVLPVLKYRLTEVQDEQPTA